MNFGRRGRLNVCGQWGDLRKHLQIPNGQYKPNTITAVPRNQSMTEDGSEIGNYVKRNKNPQNPMAWRIRPPKKSGKFQLIKDPEDDKATRDAEFARAKSVVESVLVKSDADGDTYPLRGLPYRYDEPYEPVALEDWGFLRENSKIGIETPRWNITYEFARWTTHSALRNPGSPIRGRAEVYSALSIVDFRILFNRNLGSIGKGEFDVWHRDAINKLCGFNSKLNVGWAAKIIAIYLKTTCYLAGFGREGLESVIHPPIDNILIQKLRRRFRHSSRITPGLDRFDTISRMDLETYEAIIQSFELIAKEKGCTLFEVEQYFQPG